MEIHHRTGVYAAYKIVKSQKIWSKDGYKQANFHTERYGGGSDCKNEITLNFEWNGKYVANPPDVWPGQINTLYRTPWAGDPESLWALILFPGTNQGLELIGYSNVEIEENNEAEHKSYLLKLIDKMIAENLSVSVPLRSDRTSIIIPSNNSC